LPFLAYGAFGGESLSSTLSIFHESFLLTYGFFPLTSLENKTARLNLFWFNMKQSVMSEIDFLQIIPSMV
jgi:hypothetical protein